MTPEKFPDGEEENTVKAMTLQTRIYKKNQTNNIILWMRAEDEDDEINKEIRYCTTALKQNLCLALCNENLLFAQDIL
ncbi:15031_t:CDS:2 [Entrophospora sp. SA101]|nr:15031_t:CDS:2 [Entrophospora sp. SA101]